MRMSELSQRSGVPIPSIKFYIREGLLPAGAHTAKNQADYGEAHLERLDLIRTLRDAAGFDLSTIARITRAMDGATSLNAVGAAIDAAKKSPDPTDNADPVLQSARAEIEALSARHGWTAHQNAGFVEEASRALSVVRRSLPGMLGQEALDFYAKTSDQIAEFEIPETWDPTHAQTEWLKYALLGTYLVEPLLLALRRMAHEQRAHKLEGRHPSPMTTKGKTAQGKAGKGKGTKGKGRSKC